MPTAPTEVLDLLKPFTADAVMNGATTLIGAFLGAMLAFVFQIYLNYRQNRLTSLTSAHRIMFCLLQQINTLVLIQKDFIFPHLKDSGKFISIPAVHEFDATKHVFDFATFDFMLKNSKSRAVMYDLYFAQESYIEALTVLNARSKMHREEVQSKLAAAGIQNGGETTFGAIKGALGPYVYPSIVNSTDQLIDVLSGAFAKLVKSKAEFRSYAVKAFGTNDFTEFDFPDTYGLTQPQK